MRTKFLTCNKNCNCNAHQIAPHPWRTSSPLRSGLGFRYTHPRESFDSIPSEHALARTHPRLVAEKTSAHNCNVRIYNIQGKPYADIHDIAQLERPGNPRDQGPAETRARRSRSRQEGGCRD